MGRDFPFLGLAILINLTPIPGTERDTNRIVGIAREGVELK